MSLEVYKEIENYPNYAVSTWGRVMRVDKGLILEPEVTEKGYLRVDLYNEGKGHKHYKVHRLVANAFIPNKHGKKQVNHIDGNKLNNSISNLEWVTDAENKAKRKSILCKSV